MTVSRGRSGVLVALEGIDGAGKSTLQRRLARRWRIRGWEVVSRREPTDPELGLEALRADVTDPWRAAAYFTLDRLRASAGLRCLLEAPRIVLLDRSFFSTLAYQGSRMPPTEQRRLEQLQLRVTEIPDRVLLLDLDPGLALERVGTRGWAASPAERLENLTRVAAAYRRLSHRKGWIVLDARQLPQELVHGAARRLEPWFRRRLLGAQRFD